MSPPTPLIVNVIELLRRPGNAKDINLSVNSSDLAFGDDRIVDEPVEVSVHLESLPNGISVRGRAIATWKGECRRCLAPLCERMPVDVDEFYQVVTDTPEAYAIQNDQINLLPMVRENLLVAIPVGPLCRQDCPGFCPLCGIDLAAGSCSCSPAPRDDRWDALEVVRDRLNNIPE